MRKPVQASLRARMRPLHVAVALQGFMLWPPIEKLFLSEIGFDAAAVGIMAAAYAAFVPLVEVCSGLLADRWSRRGVLVVSSAALALTCLIGGLSTNVATYLLSALALGVYFAMYSGTMEAIVYDTVLEETGGSGSFEQRIGRIRLAESATLVASSLLGGWLASLTGTRLTYFLTIPFALLSIVAYLRFDEPTLHQTSGRVPLRAQLVTTGRALSGGGRLLPIVALSVLTAVTMQSLFEFGPLWLVALAVPAFVFGPYWAGLMSTLGLGGLLAGRFGADRRGTRAAAAIVMLVAALTLATGAGAAAAIAAQIALTLLLMVASIHVARVLHDSVPSNVRAGVASGVGAMTWLTFLPVALAIGFVSSRFGIQSAGLLITAGTVAAGLLWVTATGGRPAEAAGDPSTEAPREYEPATSAA
ncbi:MAG TPA: MFS transporter [Pseudonocardiaceae bacterium]|nr:MFS transporter [Pseudonocardiaceae bacterium]